MKSIFIFLLLLSSLSLMSQHSIQGHIYDQEDQALVGATVVLLDQDSTMVAFSLTNDKGKLLLEEVEKADYILQVSYISFANYSAPLNLDWQDKKINIDPIKLQASSEVLQEITIKAEHIPMGLKGDTLSYNASAFKTKPNATVEDLLKKLPGIEVDRNGAIKAQGEDVENVLVDGKEFFGSDPKMATKNLEAEAIDKVEVYDKKSEIAEFTGVDDGDEEKTINLKLKEDHKKGGFGNVKMAGGTENSYDGKLNYFRFTPALQSSVILATNNINQETFTINDRIDFMGGMMNALAGGGLNLSGAGGLQDGINRSLSAGANLNYDFSPKLQIRSHYVLNGVGNDLEKVSDISGFADDFEYANAEELNSSRERLNHQINTKLNYKVNPFLELTFKNNFELTNAVSSSMRRSEFSRDGLFQGFTTSSLGNQSENLGFDSNTLIKKKFEKKGRNLISSFTYHRSADIQEDEVINTNRVSDNSLDLNQIQEFNNSQTRISGTADYTEPLSKKFFLKLSYSYGFNQERPMRDYFDIQDATRSLNTLLSADYLKTYQYNLAGFSVKRNTNKSKLTVGLKAQFTDLTGIINDGEQTISNQFTNLLPSFNWEYDVSSGQSLNASLNSNVTAPRLEQLLPLPNNISANFEYIGNPALVPSSSQRYSMGYNYYDNFNFTNFWANLSFTRTNNRIVTRTNIDENLFRTIQPINVDDYYRISSYTNFSRPFKPLKINYRIRTRVSFAEYESFINDLSSRVVDANYNLRFSINNRKTKFFSAESGITLDYFTKKYGINPDFNQNYFNTDFFFESEFYLPKAWVISTDFNYVQFSQESFSDDPSYALWSASVSKFFLENKLEVKLSAFDLLNQNIGFRRQGNTNSLRQESFNNLSRYLMLGVQYKIGKAKKRGIQVDFD